MGKVQPNKRFHPTSAPVMRLACESRAPCRLRRLRGQVRPPLNVQGLWIDKEIIGALGSDNAPVGTLFGDVSCSRVGSWF